MRTRRAVLLVVAVAAVLALVASPVQVGALVPRTARGGAIVLALVAAVVGWSRLVVPRLTRRPAVRAALSAAPLVALLAVLLVPAMVDREVDEALLAGVPVAPPQATPLPTPPETAPPDPSASSEAAVPAAAPAPMPAPERLTSGQVQGVGHRATGEAVVYRVGESSFVRLQDLDVQGAVDVFVWLVPDRDQTEPDGGVDLGALKGTRGSANYVLPAGVDPARYGAVLLWCRAFSTPIAVAPQA